MNRVMKELGWHDLLSSARTLGIGSYAIITVLLVLLVGTIVLAYFGWSSAARTDVPLAGYVAMAIGVLVSIAVGSGLMALVFYSSRAGYDEPAKLITSESDKTLE
jgi:hypothetical protein